MSVDRQGPSGDKGPADRIGSVAKRDSEGNDILPGAQRFVFGSEGLTLIEIIIAITLIALASGVYLTRRGNSNLGLDADARRLGLLVTECYQAAVLRSRPVRIRFNEDPPSATLEIGFPEQFDQFSEDTTLMATPFKFSNGVSVDLVKIPGQESEEKILPILCLPQGYVQPATLFLKDTTENRFHLVIQSFTGLARVYPGWPEQR